jgi:uncharacterized repeat protein (TIGR01451 family)
MSAHRWRVGLLATLVLTGVGLVFAEPTLLATAVIPLTYVCYGLLSGLSSSTDLVATRTFDPEGATPGEQVTVTLRVENAGDTVLPDVRVVDRVPDLAVVEGAPRAVTALAPGETLTVEYTVVTRRGDHEFEDPLVRLRSLAASTVRTETLSVETATLSCATPARDPVAEAVLSRSGLSVDSTGEGSEFYATREYRRGDPMRRVDWRHVAKTGEFVTIQYRDQQTDRVAVVVDTRRSGRVQPAAGHPSGAALAVEIGQRLVGTLDRSDVLAGAGVVGLDPESRFAGSDGVAWAGGDGRPQPSTLLDAVREHLDGAPIEPAVDERHDGETTAAGQRVAPLADGGPGELTGAVLDRLPSNAQVLLCTPALDDWPVAFGRVAAERGHELVVVSPDVTREGDVRVRLAGVERRLRLRRLDAVGETIDWTPGDARIEIPGVGT